MWKKLKKTLNKWDYQGTTSLDRGLGRSPKVVNQCFLNKIFRCLKEIYASLDQRRWGVHGGIDIMMESRRKIKQRDDAQRLKKQQLGIKD